VPILAAAAVFLVGAAAASWIDPDSSWQSECPAAASREASGGFEVRPSLWPPGTRCVVTLASGREVTDTYVPVREWLFVLFGAAIVWWVLANPESRRRRTGPPIERPTT
jgi:hypothetical protein